MMSEATVKSTISVDANAVKKTPAARNDKQLPDIDFDRFKTSRSFAASRKRKDVFMKSLICLAFIIACIPLISVLWTTVANGIKRLNLNFLSYNMSGVVGGSQTPSGGYGGVLHAIIGTLEITLGAMVISVPVGLMCAVYLIEYAARGNKLAKSIGLLVDVMSGIPSIVAGLFAYSMFSLIGGPGTISGFEGSVALSLLMIPTVVKTSEEMLKVVPGDLREASYALGVSKQRTICKIVLRTALPGIVSGVIHRASDRRDRAAADDRRLRDVHQREPVQRRDDHASRVRLPGIQQAACQLPAQRRLLLRHHDPDGTLLGRRPGADHHRADPQPHRPCRGSCLRREVRTVSRRTLYIHQ